MFVDALDVSMVGVALPSTGSELGLSTSTLQWIVSGYILGYGGLLLLGGRTADLLGRRQVFLVALGVFALASLLSGLVNSGPLLIASRFIKGLRAAFTAPAGLSIITMTFPEGLLRNRALSIYTTCAATGFSMDLVLSGLLTETSWRLTMLLPAPIAVIALIAGLKLIPRSERDQTTRLRHPGRRPRHRLDAAARLHRRPGSRGGLDHGPYAAVVPHRRRPAHRVRTHRAAQPEPSGPTRRTALRQPDPGTARRHGLLRLVRQLPVSRHALHAVAARLIGPAHRARHPPAGALVALSATKTGPSSTGSARRGSSWWASP
jgi:hypothetical protein